MCLLYGTNYMLAQIELRRYPTCRIYIRRKR